MTTDISKIYINDDENDEIEDEYINPDNIQKYIFDLSLSIKKRKKAIEMYYDMFNNEMVEIINKLSGMYIFSNTVLLENYINELCLNSNLPINLKVILVQALTTPNYDNKVSKYGYSTLNKLCNDLGDLPTPIKIETVKILMKDKSNNYQKESLTYFCNIINNKDLECEFRYKSILSLELNIDIDKYYIEEIMYSFMMNNNNMTRYRILSAQYILQHNFESKKDNTYVILMSFAKDINLDTNIRADSADVILRFGNDEYKKMARDIIHILSSVSGNVKTIYENAQNVHTVQFEENVSEGIEFLSSFQISTYINFDYVNEKINDLVKIKYNIKNDIDKEIIDKIKIAMNRIYMDRALYSKYNSTLTSILLKVWSYIEYNKENSDQMKNRMLEELIDMSGTCSTGYAERLINVISGFGDFNYTISWEDQIVSNLCGRLNHRARNINETNGYWNNDSKLEIIVDNLINDSKLLERLIISKYVKDNKISGYNTDDFNKIKNKYEEYINSNSTDTNNSKKKGKNTKDLKRSVKILSDNEFESLRNKLLNDKKYPSKRDKLTTYLSIFTNNYILDIFQDKVLNEMTMDVSNYTNRKYFLTFFRECLLSITEEMYNEFKEHITDTDFNLYIRKAISTYEGLN